MKKEMNGEYYHHHHCLPLLVPISLEEREEVYEIRQMLSECTHNSTKQVLKYRKELWDRKKKEDSNEQKQTKFCLVC